MVLLGTNWIWWLWKLLTDLPMRYFLYRTDYIDTNVESAVTTDSLKTTRDIEEGLGCCDDPHIMKVDRDAFAR